MLALRQGTVAVSVSCLLYTVLLGCGGSSPAETGWQRFTQDSTFFSIEFPAAPTVETSTFRLPASKGTPSYQSTTAQVSMPWGRCGVQWFTIPGPNLETGDTYHFDLRDAQTSVASQVGSHYGGGSGARWTQTQVGNSEVWIGDLPSLKAQTSSIALITEKLGAVAIAVCEHFPEAHRADAERFVFSFAFKDSGKSPQRFDYRSPELTFGRNQLPAQELWAGDTWRVEADIFTRRDVPVTGTVTGLPFKASATWEATNQLMIYSGTVEGPPGEYTVTCHARAGSFEAKVTGKVAIREQPSDVELSVSSRGHTVLIAGRPGVANYGVASELAYSDCHWDEIPKIPGLTIVNPADATVMLEGTPERAGEWEISLKATWRRKEGSQQRYVSRLSHKVKVVEQGQALLPAIGLKTLFVICSVGPVKKEVLIDSGVPEIKRALELADPNTRFNVCLVDGDTAKTVFAEDQAAGAGTAAAAATSIEEFCRLQMAKDGTRPHHIVQGFARVADKVPRGYSTVIIVGGHSDDGVSWGPAFHATGIKSYLKDDADCSVVVASFGKHFPGGIQMGPFETAYIRERNIKILVLP